MSDVLANILCLFPNLKTDEGCAEYVDTTVILNEADTTFAGTLGTNEVTSTGLKTEDNKVFTVETINVQAHTYNL